MEKPPHDPHRPTTPNMSDATQPEGPAAGATEPYGKPQADAGPEASVRAKMKSNLLGDFRLLKKLGQGGMGAVYQAEQISLERPVALKIMSKKLAADTHFIQRFYREARLLAKLDHPNIVHGYAVGEEHGYHYCAMEYVDGGSLKTLLKGAGTLNVGDALHVLITCARAMGHAHEQNLIHRDIKPDNILLTKEGVLKVADLGLAKALDEELSLTTTGTGAGTPFYMAPEQYRDAKRVDARSDIYSLGCMLYELLTGKLPYTGSTDVEVLSAKEEGKHVPARRMNVHVPERLDLIIDKMVARKPEHRYQTCAELVKDLEGLGLAHDSLECLQEAEAAARGKEQGKKSRRQKVDIPLGPTMVAPRRERAETSALTEPPPGDWWYVSHRSPQGRIMRQRLTTHQVLLLIDDEQFDVSAQATRTADGELRSLGTYREFEPALRVRLTRVKAERKAQKFRRFYDKIEEEERSRQRWRWLRNQFRTLMSWIAMLVVLAIVAAVGYGLYLVVPIFFKWLTAKMGLQ